MENSRTNNNLFVPPLGTFFNGKKHKCIETIEVTPPEEVEAFRIQERERFRDPKRPFVYEFMGQRSVVAPARKSGGSKQTVKVFLSNFFLFSLL